MSETLSALLTDPWLYLIVLVVAGLARWYLKRRIEAGVDHHFSLRLEDHKQALGLAAQTARYGFEQQLLVVNLYAEKRHTAAVDVYKALRIAHGLCTGMTGFRQELTFEEFNDADLREYMTDRKVPRGKQDEIVERLVTDRTDAIGEMRNYVRMLERQEASNELRRARNTTYLNELYFDDETIAALDEFFALMDQWMFQFYFPRERERRSDLPTMNQMRDALEAIHDLLRSRLSGGSDEG